eukprot:TRINITY_DN43232_c0_g1_i1.p1 TRINITY_DN43232_c0_g1~~TRINITY_DN43232_c0_g1_i1.p1  ORF type:complete len:334 (+),score=69.19 TRINITY_DN43232_c0_g1_i1:81-1004(+)
MVEIKCEVSELFDRAEERLGEDPRSALADLSTSIREQAIREERLAAIRKVNGLPVPDPEDSLNRLRLLGCLSRFVEPKAEHDVKDTTRQRSGAHDGCQPRSATQAQSVASACVTPVADCRGRGIAAMGALGSPADAVASGGGEITLGEAPTASELMPVAAVSAGVNLRYCTDYTRFSTVGDDTGSDDESKKEGAVMERGRQVQSAVDACDRRVSEALATAKQQAVATNGSNGSACFDGGGARNAVAARKKIERLRTLEDETRRLRELAQEVWGPAVESDLTTQQSYKEKKEEEQHAKHEMSLLQTLD